MPIDVLQLLDPLDNAFWIEIAGPRANAERERTVLVAEARAQADNLRGQGEAQAIALYADAFQRDPAFFQAWRTLQAYRDAFATGNARLVMTPGDDFLKFLSQMPHPQSAAPVLTMQPAAQ